MVKKYVQLKFTPDEFEKIKEQAEKEKRKICNFCVVSVLKNLEE